MEADAEVRAPVVVVIVVAPLEVIAPARVAVCAWIVRVVPDPELSASNTPDAPARISYCI